MEEELASGHTKTTISVWCGWPFVMCREVVAVCRHAYRAYDEDDVPALFGTRTTKESCWRAMVRSGIESRLESEPEARKHRVHLRERHGRPYDHRCGLTCGLRTSKK